jgi:hypothetical protein
LVVVALVGPFKESKSKLKEAAEVEAQFLLVVKEVRFLAIVGLRC